MSGKLVSNELIKINKMKALKHEHKCHPIISNIDHIKTMYNNSNI